VMPENEPAAVAAVLSRLGVATTAVFEVVDPMATTLMPGHVTAGELSARCVGLNYAVPRRRLAPAGARSCSAGTVSAFIAREMANAAPGVDAVVRALSYIEQRTYSLASERDDVADLVVTETLIGDVQRLAARFMRDERVTRVAVWGVEGVFAHPARARDSAHPRRTRHRDLADAIGP